MKPSIIVTQSTNLINLTSKTYLTSKSKQSTKQRFLAAKEKFGQSNILSSRYLVEEFVPITFNLEFFTVFNN